MKNLSICIICKNEEKYLRQCLLSLGPLQCEVIIVDTGSTDKSVEIARKFTSNIYEYKWSNDFSAARNFAASKASNDWILAIDCDEYLVQADFEILHKLFADHPLDVGMIHRISPYSSSGLSQNFHEHIARLYNRKYFTYKGIIHENVAPISDNSSEMKFFEVPLTIFHVGYSEAGVIKEKAERDLRLLQETLRLDGPSAYTYYQLGKCYVIMKNPALAAHYFELGLAMNENPKLNFIQEMVESYGSCLLDLKQYEKALSFEAIYNDFCSRADFVFLMGLIYMNNARFDDAIKEFKKAMTLKNYSVDGVNSFAASYNIGVIYECLGNHDDALFYYKKCGNYAPALKRINAIS